jgi:hypothetical protein
MSCRQASHYTVIIWHLFKSFYKYLLVGKIILEHNQVPKKNHILSIETAPLFIVHLNALQCGAATINGEYKYPIKVFGVQK